VKRLIYRFAIIIGLSVVLFVLMESFLGYPSCFDCPGYQYGFPFAFREEAGFVGPDRVLWLGLFGDLALAIAVSMSAVWMWHHLRNSK
jgi:hypothetical protein